MKKRYELQLLDWETHKWVKSKDDSYFKTLKEKLCYAKDLSIMLKHRVVQKLGRKVIKVIYPEGK